MKNKIVFLFFAAALIFSCQSVPKNITYFQDLNEGSGKTVGGTDYVQHEARIKNSDVLMITVSSPTLNQEEVAQFNLPTTSYLAPGESATVQSTTLQTYIVDKNGEVNYPVIGKVKIGGHTLLEAIDVVAAKVSEYLEDPIINISILSFKVSVLGDVNEPGPVAVNNSRISILEAIAAAGDLTIYGNRKNVKLIRDNDGQREYAVLDLTLGEELFSSPYFYLQQNDVIYIESNDTRKKESRYGQADSYKLSLFGSALGVLSVIASTIIAITSISSK